VIQLFPSHYHSASARHIFQVSGIHLGLHVPYKVNLRRCANLWSKSYETC